MKPKLLDLFCGAGGSAKGYADAGFEVTGVDLSPMPNFPFTFIQADAFEYLREHGHEYDVIHASPPCQRYSTMTKRWDRSGDHPDFIGPIRDLLVATGKPYVIENVIGAPLVDPIMLCGSMFDLSVMDGTYHYQLRRHRLFESNVKLAPPQSCDHQGLALPVYGHAGGTSKRDGLRFPGTWAWRIGMGISWMTGKELKEAIPPAFTNHVGSFLLEAVTD